MKRSILTLALALGLATVAVAQQPQPKSQKEVDAIMAIQNAQDPNARIAAANTLLKEFADTEFKEFANYMLMLSYQQLNDFDNMMIYGEETLNHNPDNVGVLLQLSYAIPSRTREFDLDKEEKLNKAEDFAKRAITLVPNQEKPNPNLSDDEWLLAKKDFMSQAHISLGLVELKRENFAKSETEFREALTVAPQQSAEHFYYVALALQKQDKKDEAVQFADKAIAAGGFPLGDGTDAAAALKQQIQASN